MTPQRAGFLLPTDGRAFAFARAMEIWRAAIMTPGKSRRLAEKSARLQAEVLEELQAIAKAIERAESSIATLKEQMEAVNLKHQDRKTTADDIAYLEDLLKCARRKLEWEKQMASLAKRMPEALAKVSSVMNNPESPPTDQTRAAVMQLLQSVQQAMAALQKAKET